MSKHEITMADLNWHMGKYYIVLVSNFNDWHTNNPVQERLAICVM